VDSDAAAPTPAVTLTACYPDDLWLFPLFASYGVLCPALDGHPRD